MRHSAALLEQASRLVQAMTDEAFVFTTPIAPGGSSGRHLRHCLDFYEAFLRGRRSGRIDYVERERDQEVETRRARALERIREITRGMAGLRQTDLERPLLVRAEDEADWCGSTVRRELQFLASHTVHHLATIAMLLRTQGHETPADLGVAPSTLLFRSKTTSEAAASS